MAETLTHLERFRNKLSHRASGGDLLGELGHSVGEINTLELGQYPAARPSGAHQPALKAGFEGAVSQLPQGNSFCLLHNFCARRRYSCPISGRRPSLGVSPMPWPQHSPRWGFFSGPGALDAVRADFGHVGGFSGISANLPLFLAVPIERRSGDCSILDGWRRAAQAWQNRTSKSSRQSLKNQQLPRPGARTRTYDPANT